MAITSVWFLSGPRVMRVDNTTDGEQRSWGPVSVGQALPALAAIGVAPQDTAAKPGDAFAMTATTAIVNGVLQDLSRGGAAAGRPFFRAFNGVVGIPSMTGYGVPGKALVGTSEGSRILDAVQDELTPTGGALTFSSDQDGSAVEPSAPAAGLSDTVIICFEPNDSIGSGPGFRSFDTESRVAGANLIPIAEAFPPLAAAGIDNIEAMFSTSGDPDDWGDVSATADVPTAVLRAITETAAQVNDLDKLALAVICDLESGLRPDAFHPLGRYGLLQLDVSALNLAGWRDDPAVLLSSPPAAQVSVMAQHLAGLDLSQAGDPGPLWASILTMRDPLPSLTPETVVAARTGPRADLYATHAAADVAGSGTITVGDLGAFFLARFDERRAQELERRVRALRA